MLAPLIYYLVAVFIYIILYGYYRNSAQKQKAQLDILANLDGLSYNSLSTSNKKPFDVLKQELRTNFYFEHLRIIFGIDLSASNEWQGRRTFGGQSLHKTLANKIYNPYQKAIRQLGSIFEDIFSNKIQYSCFGFGDEQTKDYSFFPIVATGDEFSTHERILDAYLEQTNNVVLSGPTEFSPMIEKLVSFGIHCRRDFTMLIILTDELKTSHENKQFVESIRMLTNLPNVCLIVVGVGDGPWKRMSYEEHCIRGLVFEKPKKKTTKGTIEQSKVSYDNFHFVDFNAYYMKAEPMDNENYLARAVLKKLPTQLKQALHHHGHDVQS